MPTTPNPQNDFDLIRSYRDDEVTPVISELLISDEFSAILRQLGLEPKAIALQLQHLSKVNTIAKFQDWIESIFLPFLERSYSKLTIEGLDKLSEQDSYLFISNHRDIVMDPLLINLALRRNRMATAHCAIGDNLLLNQTAKHLAKLNRCFTVLRSERSPKAMLRLLRLQSAYIQQLRLHQSQNIWIAQREGRSKDNQDITNPALLKMLALNRDKQISPSEYLNQLKIVAVSISYELDPCDVVKAKQLQSKEDSDNYIKSAVEDFEAVKLGLSEPKGEISLHFSHPFTFTSNNYDECAAAIDASIHAHYRIFPINLAAAILTNAERSTFISKTENVEQAIVLLKNKTRHLSDNIRQRVLRAYAAPWQAKNKAAKFEGER